MEITTTYNDNNEKHPQQHTTNYKTTTVPATKGSTTYQGEFSRVIPLWRERCLMTPINATNSNPTLDFHLKIPKGGGPRNNASSVGCSTKHHHLWHKGHIQGYDRPNSSYLRVWP
jgi:hypothetical protein